MKNTFLILTVFACTLLVNGQTYEQMETRFYKPALNEIDSSAFIELGKQKAQSLFYQTDLYLSNSGNTSNQAYIAKRIPDLFYVEKGDTIEVDTLMSAIQQLTITNNSPVTFRCDKHSGYLCRLTSTNTKPVFQFNLVLKKVLKQFGKEEEEVWEVFLNKPVILQ